MKVYVFAKLISETKSKLTNKWTMSNFCTLMNWVHQKGKNQVEKSAFHLKNVAKI